MEEEKKTMSDTLTISTKKLAVGIKFLLNKIFRRDYEKINEKLAKKIARLEEKKKRLEVNISEKEKNKILKERVKQLKEDISKLKSIDKEKLMKEFNSLVIKGKSIVNESVLEANSILKNLEDRINPMLEEYKIAGREIKQLELRGEDVTLLNKRLGDYEKNIKMMIEEYNQTYSCMEQNYGKSLIDKLDLNKQFLNIKDFIFNNAKDKAISADMNLDLKSEIEKYKANVALLKSQINNNKERISALKSQKAKLMENDNKSKENLVSKVKDEKIIGLETKDIEIDKYDFTNKDNPSYVVIQERSNSVTRPNEFQFKGSVEDIKFFDDNQVLSFKDIKLLNNTKDGLGEEVFQSYLNLTQKGYLDIKKEDNFADSKFEITEKGKQFIKESNFGKESNLVSSEKVGNKSITESTKIKSSEKDR